MAKLDFWHLKVLICEEKLEFAWILLLPYNSYHGCSQKSIENPPRDCACSSPSPSIKSPSRPWSFRNRSTASNQRPPHADLPGDVSSHTRGGSMNGYPQNPKKWMVYNMEKCQSINGFDDWGAPLFLETATCTNKNR